VDARKEAEKEAKRKQKRIAAKIRCARELGILVDSEGNEIKEVIKEVYLSPKEKEELHAKGILEIHECSVWNNLPYGNIWGDSSCPVEIRGTDEYQRWTKRVNQMRWLITLKALVYNSGGVVKGEVLNSDSPTKPGSIANSVKEKEKEKEVVIAVIEDITVETKATAPELERLNSTVTASETVVPESTMITGSQVSQGLMSKYMAAKNIHTALMLQWTPLDTHAVTIQRACFKYLLSYKRTYQLKGKKRQTATNMLENPSMKNKRVLYKRRVDSMTMIGDFLQQVGRTSGLKVAINKYLSAIIYIQRVVKAHLKANASRQRSLNLAFDKFAMRMTNHITLLTAGKDMDSLMDIENENATTLGRARYNELDKEKRDMLRVIRNGLAQKADLQHDSHVKVLAGT